ncbi:HIRAN domain-containing protein [Bifidobacterium bombi]|uniref:DNA-binding HIRAN domain protein n=1 Tax=Bifidobacterium bombi DSM 19703 TaxID=1341695 RepID=A0A080N4S8_9BIFI|nr:HIRAN domain-containing protein [Bifidobacterium bombi]KFF31685.1 DNA-binding HIRAN domain protein [Bifidobacterium bombi DSM 19703]
MMGLLSLLFISFIVVPLLVALVYLIYQWVAEDNGESTTPGNRDDQKTRQRPETTVFLQTTEHPHDPLRGKPIKDQTAYAPIYSQFFLPPEHQLDLVTVDSQGNTNLKLGLYNGQLVLEAPNGLLPCRASGQIYKLGIFTGTLRGTSYYDAAFLRADTRPLRPAILRREPGNKYDRNAIAILAPNAGIVGYVNKQNAARLSKRLDKGAPYMAIFTSGSPSGQDSTPTSILIAPENTLQSILKNSVPANTNLIS